MMCLIGLTHRPSLGPRPRRVLSRVPPRLAVQVVLMLAIGLYCAATPTTAHAFDPDLDEITLSAPETLFLTDSPELDSFGGGVALDGDWLAVSGASQSFTNRTTSVFVLQNPPESPNHWEHVVRLDADISAGDSFRTDHGAMALEDDWLFIGGFCGDGADSSSSCVFIHHRDEGGQNQWGLVEKIYSPMPSSGGSFGSAMDVSGDTLVVGADKESPVKRFQGQAHVFMRNEAGTWDHVSTMRGADVRFSDFGRSVATDSEYIIVGAPLEDLPDRDNIGMAYIYRRDQGGENAWGLWHTLFPPFGAVEGDRFGYAVDVDAGNFVISSPHKDLNLNEPLAGALYFVDFDESGEAPEPNYRRIHPPTTSKGAFFGRTVAIEGNLIVAGAPRHRYGGLERGRAFLFGRAHDEGTSWQTVTELINPDSPVVQPELYATAIGMDGRRVVVSAPASSVGTSTSGLVDVFVLNHPPEARNDSYAGFEDTPLTVPSNDGLTSNDIDVDGDSLTVEASKPPEKGDVEVNPDGSFTYTPRPDVYGTDTFQYRLTDFYGARSSAIVNILISSRNDAPRPADDNAVTDEDTPVLIDVLSNDVELDDEAMVISGVGPPKHGTANIVSDSVEYTPELNFHGTDEFWYEISDTQGNTGSGTVVVSVQSVNDRPISQDLEVSTAAGEPLAIQLEATDVDSDSLQFTIVTSPEGGTLEELDSSSGTVTYVPDPRFSGIDSFAFRANDGDLESETGTVTVSVDEGFPEPTDSATEGCGCGTSRGATPWSALIWLGAILGLNTLRRRIYRG